MGAVPRYRVLKYVDGGGGLVVVYLLLATAIEYATPPMPEQIAAIHKLEREWKCHEGVHDCSFGKVMCVLC